MTEQYWYKPLVLAAQQDVKIFKKSEDSLCMYAYIYAYTHIYVASSITGSKGALQALLNKASQRHINITIATSE